MRPLLLDEAQGLTDAKRDAYLIAKGWTAKGGGWRNEPHSLSKPACQDRDGAWLRFLADFEGRSIQGERVHCADGDEVAPERRSHAPFDSARLG